MPNYAITDTATNPDTAYLFEALVGRIVTVSKQLQVIERPGVDGHGLRDTGTRAQPFTLQGMEYVESRAAADTQLAAYKDLQALGGGVQVTQGGIDYSPFDVLDVQFRGEPRQVARAVSQLVTNPTHMLATVWTLKALNPTA